MYALAIRSVGAGGMLPEKLGVSREQGIVDVAGVF